MGFMCGVPENRDMCKNNRNFKVIEPFFFFFFFWHNEMQLDYVMVLPSVLP